MCETNNRFVFAQILEYWPHTHGSRISSVNHFFCLSELAPENNPRSTYNWQISSVPIKAITNANGTTITDCALALIFQYYMLTQGNEIFACRSLIVNTSNKTPINWRFLNVILGVVVPVYLYYHGQYLPLWLHQPEVKRLSLYVNVNKLFIYK